MENFYKSNFVFFVLLYFVFKSLEFLYSSFFFLQQISLNSSPSYFLHDRGCIIFSLEILCWTLECNCLKLIHLPKVCIYSCDQSHGFWIFVQQPKLIRRKRQKVSNCMKRFISHLVQTISCTMLHNCHTTSDKWLIC